MFFNARRFFNIANERDLKAVYQSVRLNCNLVSVDDCINFI